MEDWLSGGEPLQVSAVAWTEFLCGPVRPAHVEWGRIPVRTPSRAGRPGSGAGGKAVRAGRPAPSLSGRLHDRGDSNRGGSWTGHDQSDGLRPLRRERSAVVVACGAQSSATQVGPAGRGCEHRRIGGDRAMTIGLATRFREASQGPGYRWWVLAAVECANFVVYMDGFIVTLALPAMARQFGWALRNQVGTGRLPRYPDGHPAARRPPGGPVGASR